MSRNSFNLLRPLARLAAIGSAMILSAAPSFGASDRAPQSQPTHTEQSVAEQRVRVYDEDYKTRQDYAQASPSQTQTPEGQKLNTDDGTKLRIDVYTGNDYAK